MPSAEAQVGVVRVEQRLGGDAFLDHAVREGEDDHAGVAPALPTDQLADQDRAAAVQRSQGQDRVERADRDVPEQELRDQGRQEEQAEGGQASPHAAVLGRGHHVRVRHVHNCRGREAIGWMRSVRILC